MEKTDTDTVPDDEQEPASPSGLKKWLPLALGMFLIVMVSQVIAPIITQPIMARIYPPAEVAGEQDAAEETGEEEEEEPLPSPIYWPLNPPMVVNLDDSPETFLQVTLEVMAREQETIEAVKTHNAAIRNALLMSFASQSAEAIGSREGREQLRLEALEEVQKVLVGYVPEEQNVEEVFFTSFVAQ